MARQSPTRMEVFVAMRCCGGKKQYGHERGARAISDDGAIVPNDPNSQSSVVSTDPQQEGGK